MPKSETSLTQQPVVFIMGPTASGKTALAMQLYRLGHFEIISVDSAMVYRGMDIGSAKPTPAELAQTPHHLIDLCEPDQAYSAANFLQDARRLIGEIHQRGKVPLLVGGTMLYFKALQEGLADLPAADPDIREQLKQQLARQGIVALHQMLEAVDPITAARLHSTDTQRILRALEVYRVSGKSLSQWHAEQQRDALTNPVLALALAPQDRAVLHLRIAERFEQMMAQGFFAEVKRLHSRGDLNLDCPSMKSVGYRQLWLHLDGVLTFEEAIERGVIATRQLAKRQFTWLRSWPGVEWFDPLQPDQREQAAARVLAFVNRE